MGRAGNGNGIDERSLALRAAWLHYAGGLTQAAVARKLSLPSVKTHRLIARAVAEGAVKLRIDGDIVECLEMEAELSERYGLRVCEVAPDLAEPGLPLRALGIAGASYLGRLIDQSSADPIGLGHGRTLAAAVAELPQRTAEDTRFVSLLGGLTRNFAANPHDVMHRIAERTDSPAHVMPVPFCANSAEDKAVLLAQRGVHEVFEMAQSAPVKLVGLGTVDAEAQLVRAGMIDESELAGIVESGAVGELLGHFFDATGHLVATPLDGRTLTVSLLDTRDHDLVAIAGGIEKVESISAVLASGKLTGLIVDEATARRVLRRPVA
ncbi:sugar-binding transcriptional regulator [Spiribacter sp. 221]|uniref:sugar-binding transcriptional regulator n=1 Tax=Spiribacter onubensis TaxID=3122420 RepID=UPI00349FB29B